MGGRLTGGAARFVKIVSDYEAITTEAKVPKKGVGSRK
jgi:hypothetical protein